MFERFKNRGTAEDGATADGSRTARRETAVEGRDPHVDGRDRPAADGATSRRPRPPGR